MGMFEDAMAAGGALAKVRLGLPADPEDLAKLDSRKAEAIRSIRNQDRLYPPWWTHYRVQKEIER